MSEILDKLGIYDLVAVLLSGISVLTISLLILQVVYNVSVELNLMVNEMLSFLVISYFVGVVLQEAGSLIVRKTLGKNGRLFNQVMVDSYISITEWEKAQIFSYVKSQLNLKDDNSDVIYNYCKYRVFKNSDTSRIDRDQSLSAMSRSLSLYFLGVSISSAFSICVSFSLSRLLLLSISVILTILFYNRFIRFVRMRYSNILRMFYYNEQDSIQEWRKANSVGSKQII